VSARATDRQATAAAEAVLSEALHDFFRAARRARGRAARQSADELISLAQYHLLEPLLDGPLTNRELAELAGVASPTATRMVDGLVGRELVTRIEDPTDRRAVVISLTEAGRKAVSEKTREYDKARRRIAAALEPDEQPVAADLLRRLAVVIEEL
jgi:DNA-binding MarR family transcriptional regulator